MIIRTVLSARDSSGFVGYRITPAHEVGGTLSAEVRATQPKFTIVAIPAPSLPSDPLLQPQQQVLGVFYNWRAANSALDALVDGMTTALPFLVDLRPFILDGKPELGAAPDTGERQRIVDLREHPGETQPVTAEAAQENMLQRIEREQTRLAEANAPLTRPASWSDTLRALHAAGIQPGAYDGNSVDAMIADARSHREDVQSLAERVAEVNARVGPPVGEARDPVAGGVYPPGWYSPRREYSAEMSRAVPPPGRMLSLGEMERAAGALVTEEGPRGYSDGQVPAIQAATPERALQAPDEDTIAVADYRATARIAASWQERRHDAAVRAGVSARGPSGDSGWDEEPLPRQSSCPAGHRGERGPAGPSEDADAGADGPRPPSAANAAAQASYRATGGDYREDQ